MSAGIRATIMKRNLAKLCEQVAGVVGRRYPYVVLGFFSDKIVAIATGDEVSIEAVQGLEKEEEVTGYATCCLSAAELLKLIKALPDAYLTLVGQENHGLQVECGDFQGVIPGVDRDEHFPELSLFAGQDIPRIVLVGQDLDDLYGAVSHCTYREPSHITSGIHLSLAEDVITCVATDRVRLAVASRMPEQPATGTITVTVPLNAFGVLSKLTGAVTLAVKTDSMVVYHGNTTYEIRLLVGDYPDYRRIIPTTHPGCLVVEAVQLRIVIDRVAILSASDGVVLDIQPAVDESGDIRVMALGAQGDVSDLVAAEVSGEPAQIRLHPAYLLDSLKALSKKSNYVLIKYDGPGKAVLFLPADHSGWNERLEVIMPMRLD